MAVRGENELNNDRERRLILFAQQDASSDWSVENESNAESNSSGLWTFVTTDTFPGYAVQGEVHRGGQGVVYRAIQIATCRTVAIKVLRDFVFAGADAESRFRREVRLLAQIKHPHIVTIHDSAVVGGRPFFVMDFIEGLPLHTFLGTRTCSVVQILRLFLKVCEAVHAAHVRGIIHRDLKPDNILVDENENPHILDFGLARLIDDENTSQTQFRDATQEGQFVGSIPWASPEQAEGRQELIDLRSDVYSLGVILYQILTSRFPYNVRGNVRDVVDRIIRAEPVRPGQLRKEIDVDVETIVLKSLSKERERRYQSGGELARDIARYLAGEPIEARRDSTIYVLRKQLRKHWVPLVVIASFIVLLAASSVAGWTLYGSAKRATDSARAAEKEKTFKLWDAYVAQARAGRFSRKAGQRFDGLQALAEAAKIRPSMELRNEAIACLALADLRVEQLTEDGLVKRSDTATVADSAQDLWASSNSNGDISIHRFDADQPVAQLPGTGFKAIAIHVSPDERHLGVVYGHAEQEVSRYCLWSIDRREIVVDHEQRGASITEFSPDGARWALGLDDGISIFDVKDATEPLHIPLNCSTRFLSFSPDGSRIAVVPTASSKVDILDSNTGQLHRRIEAPAIITRVAWRPDGNLLAGAAQTNFNIYLWDLITEQQRSLQGHTAVSMSFSSDGEFLMSGGWDFSIRLWDMSTEEQICTIPGNLRGRLSKHADKTERHGFITPSKRLGILEVNYAPESRALRAHAGAHKAPYWIDVEHRNAGNGSTPMLAASCGKDGVRLWDLDYPRELHWLPIGETGSAWFGPLDGSLMTSGPRGIHSWPITRSSGGWQIGPPQEIWNQSAGVAAWSRDGQRLVMTATDPDRTSAPSEAIVIHLDSPNRDVLRLPHVGVNYVDISPDGRWIVTGTWQNSGVRVWNAHDGALISELLLSDEMSPDDKLEQSTLVKFSPDGRWLITSTAQEVTFWETGTWKRLDSIATLRESNVPPRVAFTTDGTLMAMNPSAYLVRLYSTESRTELATFEPPEHESARAICFSPDGGKLIVGSSENLIRIWDLQAIRNELDAIGLDWDAPASSSVERPRSSNKLRVVSELGELESKTNDSKSD